VATSRQAGDVSTILSSKGQVIIPKSVRLAKRWEAGLVFNVIETDEGILLKPRTPFAPTDLAAVAGMLKEHINPRTDLEIEAAKLEDIRSRWVDRD